MASEEKMRTPEMSTKRETKAVFLYKKCIITKTLLICRYLILGEIFHL